MKIGWIGSGLMGAPMLVRLLKAGHEVIAFSRSGRRPEGTVDVRLVSTIAEIAVESDVVFTIVGGPDDVRAIYLSPSGLLAHATPGAVLVDMTTSSVELAEELGQAGAEKGVFVLDAPVSGGPFGAESGTLSIMVGGAEQAVDRICPLLEQLGTVIVHHGDSGTGQAAKLVNQLVVGAVTEACAEAFLLAHRTGLDVGKVAESLAGGAAGSPLTRFLLGRLGEGDESPGFKVAHLRKDLDLLVAEIDRQRLTLPLAELTRDAAAVVELVRGGEVGSQLLGARLPGWSEAVRNQEARV